MADISIRKADESDIQEIKGHLLEFYLDAENVTPEQFFVAEEDGNLAGFGRIKAYENMYELSSVGVLLEYRGKGVGEKLILHIIDNFPSNDVWIVTKIPDYFRKFGFTETYDVPYELRQKCHRICINFYETNTDSTYMILRKESSKL